MVLSYRRNWKRKPRGKLPDGALLYDPNTRDDLAWQIRHGPYTMAERTSKDVTDMFFGPVKGAWKLIRGAYRWVKGRVTPFHKRKKAVSLNARAYKKVVAKLRKLGPAK